MSRKIAVYGLAVLLVLSARADDLKAVAKPAQELSALSLEQLMGITVEGAARHAQTLEDAPASVTIITAQDIRRYGYRTLAEALSATRGFYINNNRTYHTAGVRGFNLPWDYASRILVMINGHNLADHVFDSMLWFGADFPIDMTLIKQIEIIRGPSSALYGSNGVFATINVITESPDKAQPFSFVADAGSFGEKKAQVTAAAPLGRNATVLFSGSVFNNSGENPLYFPEFNSPETNNGNAVHMDGEKGYHFFSNLVWRNWSITAAVSDRNKIEPISWGDTVFNDPGTHVVENRSYVEAAYRREVGRGVLRWRTYYDQAHLGARFDYPLAPTSETGAGVEDNRTKSWSDWVGTELAYRFDLAHIGTLTAGTEAKIDLRILQSSDDVAPVPKPFVNIDRRDKQFALFLQDERPLSDRLTLNLGVRVDYSLYRHSFVSPRVALIYRPSARWSYKFLYGRAFRNPTAFDLFYDDGMVAVANPNARPEKADTFEVDVERKIGKRMNLLASAYGYRLRDFLTGVYTDNGLIQMQNVGQIHASGFAVEINGRCTSWLEASASYLVQKAMDDISNSRIPNSPTHSAKFRFAVPLGRKFDFSSSMQYYSSRDTLAASAVAPVYLADFTVVSKRLLPNLDITFGIRNGFNRTYYDPIALNPRVDAMPQPGRSFFVELIARADR